MELTTKITSKGQVTIPVAVRRKLGVKAGERVVLVFHRPGEVAFRRAVARRHPVIAIDSHLFVRHLTQDDPVQATKVARLLVEAADRAELILLTDIVLCETAWVLTRFYGVKRTDLLAAFERVLADAQFAFQHRPEVQRALRASRVGKGHFADHLVATPARTAGCRTTYTFEKGLEPTAGFTRL